MTDKYNFEDAFLLRSKDPIYWTYSRLAKKYGAKDESNIRKKYKRHALARGIQVSRYDNYVSPGIKARQLTPKQKLSNDSKNEYHGRLDLTNIRKNIKYGELEPTLQLSDMDHLEWMQKMIGFHRYRYDLPHHRELQDLLWLSDKMIGLLPRGDGKTVTYLGMTPREIAERMRPHMTITIPARTKILFRSISDTIVKKPLFRRFYGDIIAVEKGSIQANKSTLHMWLHDDIPYHDTDPVYMSVSRESENVGSRPFHIHFEDPTQRESDAGVIKLQEWYADTIRPMISLDKTQAARQTATTTRKHNKDFAAYLLKQGWSRFKYESLKLLTGRIPSHNDVVWDLVEGEDGELEEVIKSINPVGTYELLNPHWDLKELLEIAILDYSSFMSQYQNSPVSRKGNYFKNEWWLECEPFDYSQHVKYLFADTAFGMKESADFNAIGIWIVHNRRLYLVRNKLVKNLEFDEIVNVINRIAREEKVNKSYVHATLREKWVVQNLKKRMPGVEPVTETKNKVERINLLDNPWKLGDIYVFNNIENKAEAKNQWLNYNQQASTAVRKDDFVDMCATAWMKLQWMVRGRSRSAIPESF